MSLQFESHMDHFYDTFTLLLCPFLKLEKSLCVDSVFLGLSKAQ